MTITKEIQILEKKLNKKQNKVNKLIASSRIKWRRHFFSLLLLSVIIISVLLIVK